MSIVTMLTYGAVVKNNSVVVIGGGPSLSLNKDEVVSYIKRNKSTVIVANYCHDGIDADFTYFTDVVIYNEQISRIKSDNIVVPYRMILGKKKHRISFVKGKKYFQVGIGSNNSASIYHRTPSLYKGFFREDTLGMSGFGSLLISIFFKPERLLMVGFDGPSKDFKTKKTFTNKTRKYPNPSTIKIKKQYFCHRLLPFLVSNKIKLECFASDSLWGADKNGLKIDAL